MTFNITNKKKEHFFKCTKCDFEISDKQDEWIGTFNRCPNCKNYTMKAIEEGKISNYQDCSKENSISIAHKYYDHAFFHNDAHDIIFNDKDNSITVILDADKIKKEVMRRLKNECDILNTEYPHNIFININKEG